MPDMTVLAACHDLKETVFHWQRHFLCFQVLQRETEGSEGKLLDLAKRTNASENCRHCMMLFILCVYYMYITCV